MTTSKNLGSVIVEDDVVDGVPFRSRPSTSSPPRLESGAATLTHLATMSRSAVEVTTKNNQVYEGVYATFDKTTGEILLQAAYKKEPSGDKGGSPPVVYDVLSISNKNVLLVKQINAEDLKAEESRMAAKQGGGSREEVTDKMDSIGFATDKAISGGGGASSRGGMRKLEPAPAWLCSRETPEQLTLGDETGDSATGKVWEAKDMFKKNEVEYGVVSTFKEDLTGYTTKVDRSKADFKKMEDEANRIEKQIRLGRRGGGPPLNSYGTGSQYRPRLSPTTERYPRTTTPRGGPRQYPTRQFINSGARNRVEGSAPPPNPTPPQSQSGSNGGVKTQEKLESGGESAEKMQITTSKPLVDSKPLAPIPEANQTPAQQLKALVDSVAGKSVTGSGSKGNSDDEKDKDYKKKSSGFQPNIKAKEFQPASAAVASSPMQFNPNAKEFNPSSFAPSSNSRHSPPPGCSSQSVTMTSQGLPHGQPVYSVASTPMQMNQFPPRSYQAPSYSTTTTSAGGGGGHWIGMSLLGTPPGGLEMSHQHQLQPMNVSAGVTEGRPILSSVSRLLAPPQFVASQDGPFSVIRVMPTPGPILFQSGRGAAQEVQMRPGFGFR